MRRLSPLLLGLLGLVLALPAKAAEYEIFVDINEEDDLYDLQASGQIGDDTFNTLLELHRRGVDLETADRETLYALPNLTYEEVDKILDYRTQAGALPDPAALVPAGVLSRRKLESISSFLVVNGQDRMTGTSASVRYRTDWLVGDDRVPPMQLSGRVRTLRNLEMGASTVLERNTVRDVRWDPNAMSEAYAGAFRAQDPAPRPRLPKAYVMWDTPKWGVLVGTYQIGFGQRLTFDTTSRYTPNGFYPDNLLRWNQNAKRLCNETGCSTDPRQYGTPDYDWSFGLRGVAAGAKHLKLPVGWMQTYGFFSYQNHDIYQYEIRNDGVCNDATLDTDMFPECSAPYVYKGDDPDTRFNYQSLPRMYDEILGGANVSYFANRRTHVGVTGYGAGTLWKTAGPQLDFADWSRRPYGGPYGAVGVDGSWGKKWIDLFAEGSRSFDSMPDQTGGGFAGILRQTATFGTHEIELSERWYDKNYVNPYAGPISQADTLDGLRARDEAGGRLRYTGAIKKRLFIRTLADLWAEPSVGQIKTQLRARTDVQTTRWLRPGVWVQYDDKNLQASGRDQCFTGNAGDDDLTGEPIECGGQQFQLRGQVRVDLLRDRLSMTATYEHEWLDDSNMAYASSMRQDMIAMFMVSGRPMPGLRGRVRVRYEQEGVAGADPTLPPPSGEETLWIYADAGYWIVKQFGVQARYDMRLWLDDRTSTSARRPNPEHWIRLQLQGKF